MAILEIKKVTKDFGGLRALNAIDINVHQDEILGLIGPNGSGKTTLFKIIAGFEALTTGAVYYRQESVIGLRPDQVAQRGIGVVFQHNSIFPNLTAKENIMVGRHLRTIGNMFVSFFNTKGYWQQKVKLEQKAMELLEFVGMQEKSDILAKNLPHGSQRELQVAIALATEPELLLLDEPATGMNPEETVKIMALIQSIQQMGITVVVVEHNMRVIMGICTRIAVLNFGIKITEGAPGEVASHEDVISAYLGKRSGNA